MAERPPSQRKRTLGRRLQSGLFWLCVGAAVMSGLALTRQHNQAYDWTASGSNTLSAPAVGVLTKLTGPVTVTVAANERGFVRAQTENTLRRFRAHAPTLEVVYLNPKRSPGRARETGIKRFGEFRVDYEGRTERGKAIGEQTLINALLRIQQPDKRWIASLVGHGERQLRGKANHDLGLFGEALEKRGFVTREINLAETGAVPANAELLVVAAPQSAWLPGVEASVSAYLQRGGNLLVLAEPPAEPSTNTTNTGTAGRERQPHVLFEETGIGVLPGTLVAPHPASLAQLSPAITLLGRYPNAPFAKGFRDITLFPTASALDVSAVPSGWNVTEALRTSERGWLERGVLQGSVTFDEPVDLKGPFTLAATLERTDPPNRIAYVADADFLSNRYLANQGNLTLGLRIVDWLTERRDTLQLPLPNAVDRTLNLQGRALQALAFFSFLGLPLGLALTGCIVWWRRRRL